MLQAKKKTGLVFFPAFDWAISPTHPEREERLLYTQDQVFEEGLLDIEGIFEYKPDLVTINDVQRVHFCVPDPWAVMTESHFISAGGAKTIGMAVMDGKVDLMEWSLQKILLLHLDGHFFKRPPTKTRYADLAHLTTEVGVVLSVLAHAGVKNGTNGDARGAFEASLRALESGRPTMSAIDQIGIADLDRALEKLDELQPDAKSRFLTACVASIMHDQRATAAEIELLRAFASVLDCPLPPGMAE